MRFTDEMLREISGILSPEYKKDLFLDFLKKYDIQENYALAYDILFCAREGLFTYALGYKPLFDKVIDWSEMVADLLEQTSLTWEQVNACQEENFREDSSFAVLPIGAFIFKFFGIKQDYCAIELLKHWKKDFSDESIRVLFACNEYNVAKEKEGYEFGMPEYPKPEPSLILRKYLLENYNAVLGIKEIFPFILNIIATYNEEHLKQLYEVLMANLRFSLTFNPFYLFATDSYGSHYYQFWDNLMRFLSEEASLSAHQKTLDRIEMQPDFFGLEFGIARFRSLISTMSEGLMYSYEKQHNFGKQLREVADYDKYQALSELYERSDLPKEKSRLRVFMHESMYQMLVSLYTPHSVPFNNFKIMNTYTEKVQGMLNKAQFMEKHRTENAYVSEETPAHADLNKLQNYLQIMRSNEAQTDLNKLEYYLQIRCFSNKAQNYLQIRWFSSWLINSGMGNIVWFFSPLQWAKVTLTIGFLERLKDEKNQDVSEAYNLLKKEVEEAVSTHKLKKRSHCSFFSCAKPQVEESADALNDGKWFDSFNP